MSRDNYDIPSRHLKCQRVVSASDAAAAETLEGERGTEPRRMYNLVRESELERGGGRERESVRGKARDGGRGKEMERNSSPKGTHTHNHTRTHTETESEKERERKRM